MDTTVVESRSKSPLGLLLDRLQDLTLAREIANQSNDVKERERLDTRIVLTRADIVLYATA